MRRMFSRVAGVGIMGLLAPAARGNMLLFDSSTDTAGQFNAQTNPRATTLFNTATIEAIVYFTSANGAFGDLYTESALQYEDKHLRIGPNQIQGFTFGFSQGGDLNVAVNLSLNQWHHVAYVVDVNEERIYVDGVRVVAESGGGDIGDYPRSGENPAFNEGYGGFGRYRRDNTLTNSMRGYVESFRISTTARYSGATAQVQRYGDFPVDADTAVRFAFEEPFSADVLGGPGSQGFSVWRGHLATNAAGSVSAPDILASFPIPGDYNSDRYVDAADYTAWADHFGQTGTGLIGDGNRDGRVDAADYTVWADNFGQGTPPGSLVGSVPEPRVGAVLALGVLPLHRRRR